MFWEPPSGRLPLFLTRCSLACLHFVLHLLALYSKSPPLVLCRRGYFCQWSGTIFILIFSIWMYDIVIFHFWQQRHRVKRICCYKGLGFPYWKQHSWYSRRHSSRVAMCCSVQRDIQPGEEIKIGATPTLVLRNARPGQVCETIFVLN